MLGFTLNNSFYLKNVHKRVMIDFSSCGCKWSTVGQAQAIELENLNLSTDWLLQ